MRYTLLAFLCAVTVIAYIQRSALSVPSKQIEAELALTSQDMGTVWLAWYTGYAVFQLPAGWVAHRLGSKPALIGFAVTWSALTATVGAATGFTGLAVLWGLMGVAQSGIFVCAAKAVGATFRSTEQAFASGALQCSMAGGAALSVYVTGQLLGPLTWPEILAAYAVPGIAWAAAFALVVPRPEGAGARRGTRTGRGTGAPRAPGPGPVVPVAHRPADGSALCNSSNGPARSRCSSPGSRGTCKSRRA
ncbi:MFS transporter [Frigoriglobus tundricola]|uniref:MFS transporter n=1 Tax=Frigoriglobus tundricola TaxID=2774151 RepID=UPI00148EE478|nr:MFS transporter [Frigoriglobus tundricola]